MRKYAFILFVIMTSTILLSAQQAIYLKINHKTGNEDFAFGKSIKNNAGQEFTLKRLDYYISNITLYHDNDKTFLAKDTFLLIRNINEINHYLGSQFINKVDSIAFDIGIDTFYNHDDPTLWPASHPLSPKDPDMHWGWAAGYKFVVLEGKNGPDLFYDFEMHAFGDPLLTRVVVPINNTNNGDKLTIELNADYQHLFDDINLDNVIVIHGSSKVVIAVMKNLKNNVFSDANKFSGAIDVEKPHLTIAPNPTNNEIVEISLTNYNQDVSNITIIDSNGKIVQKIINPSPKQEIHLEKSGIYFVQLYVSGQPQQALKLVRL